MQNLSLQMSQVATQNNAEVSAGKVNAGMDKNASVEQNATFKMVLSKQVQSQQTPAKQAITQSGKAQQTSNKATAENNVEATALQPKRKAKAINSQHDTAAVIKAIGDDKKTITINADISLISNPNSPSIDQAKLEPNALLAYKDEIDTKSENININAQDSSAIALSAAVLVPVMNSIPLVNTQTASVATAPKLSSQLSSQIATTLENSPNKQYDLDAMLSNAMSQSKNINTSERITAEPKVAPGELVNADKAGQSDVSLTSTAKSAVVDESTNAKLMLNTMKDQLAKDTVSKEVIMPAGLQSTTQVNAASSMQQVAGASVINAYLGKAGWDQAISQKVVWMVGAGQQSATLTLNPPDLGPLQVVINVHNDQADATFISNNAEVRQALQDGMSNLRDKMSESGLQLGQANVSSGQQSQQQFNQAMQSRQASPVNNTNTVLPLEKTTGTTALTRISNGLVDTFA